MRATTRSSTRWGWSRLESSGAALASVCVGIGIIVAGWLLQQSAAVGEAAAIGPLPPSPSSLAQVSAPPEGFEGADALAEAAIPATAVPAPTPVVTAALTSGSPARSPRAPVRIVGPEHEEAVVVEGKLRRGATLTSTLRREGVPASMASRIARELAPLFDFRRAHPGDRYRVALADDGSLVSFRYRVSPLEEYRIRAEGDVWVAGREAIELERRRALIAGVVTSTLYDAIVSLGGDSQLASDFASIFAWDLDFNRSVHPGDEFRILYERLYRPEPGGDDRYVGPGGVLAASYLTAERSYTAVYFETAEGRGGYYRPDGSSVERLFLAAPLRYRRITSAYNPARFHPILKVRRPHLGIDYAAPIGTPVWSVADGTVIYRGLAGGFGRLVKVRHTNGYVSYYAHLSRYAKGLHVGQVVRQKQVVGYVGSSGLSTGPHVCFRIQKDGRYVNPATLRAPAGEPIPPRSLPGFERTRDLLLAELGPLPLVATDEAL